MVRATTGGVLRSYRANLMKSFITDNKARETVLTQRIFNSYAEDPAAAAKAFRLRKSRIMTSSQLKICDDTLHKYQGAFACLDTVSKLIDTSNSSSDISTLKSTTLRMLNDPEGDAREQLNKVLDNLSDTIIQNMNQTYGDEFIFAGADGHNVPFTVEEIDGHKTLFYRGVPVDAAVPNVAKYANGNLISCDKDGNVDPAGDYYLKMDNATAIPADSYPPAQYALYSVTSPMPSDYGIFKRYNADGTEYKPTDPNTAPDAGQYIARVADVSDDQTTEPSKVDVDQLIPIAEYEHYCNVMGSPAGTLTTVTEDLLPPPKVLEDAGGNKVLVQDPNQAKNGSGVSTQAAGDYYLTIDGDPQVISKEDYDKAKLDAEKLDYLANEKRFVDIGLGFQEDETGKLIESSAFNESVVGLSFLGYGMDEDGDPKNIYSIVQRLKDLAANAPNAGDWDKELYDEFDRLVGKLEDASSDFKTQYTNHSAGVQKLENSYDLLEDNVYSLKEQYSNLEDVNMADAISSFLWAEYCYNAALKVGNSVLSQSLMDYLQ